MNEERKLYEDWLHKSPEFGETIISAWDVWIARAALSAPAVPKGFKLVPIEPTIAMAQALLDYTDQDELHWPTDVSPNYALAAYRIMLAAAPQPQEQT